MNTYRAQYKGWMAEVTATDKWTAQEIAAEQIRKRTLYNIRPRDVRIEQGQKASVVVEGAYAG